MLGEDRRSRYVEKAIFRTGRPKGAHACTIRGLAFAVGWTAVRDGWLVVRVRRIAVRD